jgi:hypothetical protein
MLALVAAANSAVGESAPPVPEEKVEMMFKPLGIKIEQLPRDGVPAYGTEAGDSGVTNGEVEERQFISNFVGMSPVHRDQDAPRQIANLNNPSEEELAMSLHLGEREPKRLRTDTEADIDLEK